MKNKLSYCLSTVLLCCLLTACLPGKKQEEKVISDASKATQEVQAEKLAADMGIAAQMLMLNHVGTNSNNNLQTVQCGNGKVVAFIPHTSSLARASTGTNGALSGGKAIPAAIGNRMQDQLLSEFGKDAVKNKETASSAGCDTLDVSMIALNSPVLVISNDFAVKPTTTDEANGVVSMSVAKCPKVNGAETTGVIITKIMKIGEPVVDATNCGKVGIEQKGESPDVKLSQASMPNWRKQLAGDSTATVNFKCIVRDKEKNACAPIDTVKADEVMICRDNGVKESYVANPVYQKGSGTFTTDPAKRSCGKGWVGQLIARVSASSCTIKRGDEVSEPATVYDIAYVSAQCDKAEVENVVTQCPAGDGNFYARFSNAQMLKPTALEPQPSQKGKPTPSLIALPGYQPSQKTVDNVKRIANAADLYVPTVNLRTYSDENKFASELVRDMGVNVGVKLEKLINCNVVGNQCATTSTDHLLMVVDRSVSMGSKETNDLITASPDIVKTNSCKAGLKNIFKTDQAQNSCNAAKAYQATNQYNLEEVKKLHVFDFIKTPWAGKYAPTSERDTLFKQMQTALIDRDKYTPYLQYALATGWDCSGRILARTGGSDAQSAKEAFPMDMFGYCDGSASCASCPGECTSVATNTLPSLPPTQEIRRIDAANLTLEKLAKMELKPGTKVTTATFVNDTPQINTFTFCSLENRLNGACDYKLERQRLMDAFTNKDSTKATAVRYVKPMVQEVIIPTEKPVKAACNPDEQCTGPTTDNWEKAIRGNGRSEQMDTDTYDYTGCVYMPPDCASTSFSGGQFNNGPLACNEETARQNQLQQASNYAKADMWQKVLPYTQIQSMMQGAVYGPIDTSKSPYWAWTSYSPSNQNMTLYCSKRVPKGTASTCGPQIVLGKMKTAAQARLDGSFQNSYLATPKPVAYGLRYQDTDNYEFFGGGNGNSCATEVPCNGNCAAVYGNNWLQAKDTVDGREMVSFCTQRRAKDSRLDIEMCEQCDVSMCAALGSTPSAPACTPSATNGSLYCRYQYDLTSGPEPDLTQNLSITPAQVTSFQGSNSTALAYCQQNRPMSPGGNVVTVDALEAVVTPGTTTTCPSPSGGEETFQQAGHTTTTPESNYMFGSNPQKLVFNDGHDGYEYSECHSLKREWDTASLGGQPGDCVNNPTKAYPKINQQFQDLFGISVDSGDVFSSCAESTSTKAYLTSHTRGINGGNVPWLVATNGVDEYTYCAKRRPLTASSGSGGEALAACLDRCGSKVLDTETTEICNPVTDLFTGVTSPNCANVAVPSKVDYTPKVYSGGKVTKTITRYVPAKAGDAGAVPVPNNEPAWGIDFGGNTPLYKTLDLILNDDTVKQSISDRKRLSLIVVTDGVDTAGSANGVKNLCGTKDSLVSKVVASGATIKPFIISVNDDAPSIVECIANKAQSNSSNYDLTLQKQISNFTQLDKIRNALGGQPTSDRESAINFCMNNYGTYYIDERVPALSLTGNASSCRPFEVQN